MSTATLRDVARKGGVAPSTVSRALRNHPSIPPKTRERLQLLAREMGYQPDPLIVALADRRWGRTQREIGTIAWITAFPTYDGVRHSPFHATVFDGAGARAKSLGYRLEVFWVREPGMTGRRLSQILLHRGIRGVCIAPMPAGRGHLNLQWEHFSCAAVGYSMIRPNLHRASPHHFQSMVEALRQLHRRGHRRIGVWMHHEENRKVNYHWLAGILLFRELYPETICELLLGRDWDLHEFQRWARRYRFDAILGSSEITYWWSEGLDRKVASASLSWTKETNLPGIDQQAGEVGAAAVDLVVDQIRRNETGIPAHPRVVMVEGAWRK